MKPFLNLFPTSPVRDENADEASGSSFPRRGTPPPLESSHGSLRSLSLGGTAAQGLPSRSARVPTMELELSYHTHSSQAQAGSGSRESEFATPWFEDPLLSTLSKMKGMTMHSIFTPSLDRHYRAWLNQTGLDLISAAHLSLIHI